MTPIIQSNFQTVITLSPIDDPWIRDILKYTVIPGTFIVP